MTSQTPTVVVLHDGTPPPAMTSIERLAEIRYATGETLAEELPGADVLFVWDFRTDALADAWHAAEDIRWVHTASAGVDKLLIPGIVDSDVTVTNSRGVFDQPMAEYVLALVLTFAKDLHTTIRLQQHTRWQHRETERIHDTTALVIGTGPIGRAIAGQLSAAGMRVLGAGRTRRTDDPDFGTVHSSDELPGLVGGADYLILAAPLTAQTHGLLNADLLARCRRTARLINVGRGELVDQAALTDALATGGIAGAALDVFDPEPLPADSPLWTMPQVIVSPHMSGDTVGWTTELVELFGDNLTRYRSGTALRNIVDKTLGYVSGTERTP